MGEDSVKLAIAPFPVYRFLNELLLTEAQAALQYRYQASTLSEDKFEGYRRTLQQFSAELRQSCQTIADHICNLGGFPRTDLEQPEAFIEFPALHQDRRMEEALMNTILDFLYWCKRHHFRQSIPLARGLAALHLHHIRVLEVMEEAVVEMAEPVAAFS